jgi:hypothetical protein
MAPLATAGRRHNPHPVPDYVCHLSALKKADGSFAPAHMLADGRLERSGRATKNVSGCRRPAATFSSAPPTPAKSRHVPALNSPCATCTCTNRPSAKGHCPLTHRPAPSPAPAPRQRRPDSLPATPADVAPCITLSAGIVVIGDEIISGKVTDSNTPFLCRCVPWPPPSC